jgi:hypothetical protein
MTAPFDSCLLDRESRPGQNQAQFLNRLLRGAEPDAAHLFFQLDSRRYETGAMLITSNRNVAEWSTVFADPVVATAILDRLLHHSHVLTIRGDSYRLRAKRKSGLIKPPTADLQPRS